VRLLKHEDIRKVGSGSIGGSNVWRTYGRWYGAPVVLLDMAKGFAPAFVGVLWISHVAGILAGAAAMAGHARPLFLGFAKGGKMVATAAGAFIGVAPIVGLAVALFWLVTFVLSRYTSVASVASALAIPVLAVAFGEPNSVVIFAAAAGVAVIVLHRANLKRLRAGTESRFRLRKTARV